MIEFVSYDGKFPTMYEGLLVVRIDGRMYAFSPYSNESMYRSFWNRYNRMEVLEDNSITKVFGFIWSHEGELTGVTTEKIQRS